MTSHRYHTTGPPNLSPIFRNRPVVEQWSTFNMAAQGDEFIKFTPEYITNTLIGKLKCAELVFTLLAGACGSSVYPIYDCHCSSKFSFFDFVAWTAFINSAIDMIIHLLGLWDRLLWIFRHPAVFTVLCALAVVGFLIGSSLGASCAKDMCVGSKSTAGAAAFFGFVCLALFAVECFLHFKAYRSMREEARQQSSGESKPPEYIDTPPSGVVWKFLVAILTFAKTIVLYNTCMYPICTLTLSIDEAMFVLYL